MVRVRGWSILVGVLTLLSSTTYEFAAKAAALCTNVVE